LQAEIKPLVAREKDEKQLKTVIDRLNKIDAIEKSINTRQQELSDKIMIKKEALSPSEKAEFDNFDNQRALANEEKNALSKEKNDLEARKNPLTDEEKDSLREKRASIQKIEERIKDFNKPQLEAAFTAKDVQNIIGSIKESTLKKLEDSDKFSDQDKEAIREKWQKESSDSALQKAQKQIDLLKQIHQDLKQQSSFRVSLQSIENHLKSGQLLSSSAVQDMLSEVNSKLVEERERRSARDLDRESKIIAGKNITELDKINKALQKLDDERAKVPPKIANGNNAGEFKIV
jgi:chromosome segregation ATPase